MGEAWILNRIVRVVYDSLFPVFEGVVEMQVRMFEKKEVAKSP